MARRRGSAGAPRTTFSTWVTRLAERRSIGDALSDYRAAHGSHAARELAGERGISARQARRYLAGQVRRPPAERGERIRRAVPAGQRAAAELRAAQLIAAGWVPVSTRSSGNPDGSRQVGTRAVSGEMRARLDAAAAALERGDMAEAEEQVSRGLLDYGGRGSGAAEHLAVSDYDGIEVD